MHDEDHTLNGRERSVPSVAVVDDNERWLVAACTALTHNKMWEIAQHHRARMLHFLHAPRTDSLRRLAWTSALQYPFLLTEIGINSRPMPAHIAAAPIVMEKVNVTILSDGKHFMARCKQQTFEEMYLRSVGAKWSVTAGAYRLLIMAPGVAAVRKLATDYGFTLSPNAVRDIEEFDAQSAKLAELSRAGSSDFTVEGMPGLRPFQRAGVQYLAQTKRAFLCDDMGLGKTLESLATVHAISAWPAIVVTLASVKAGWLAECNRWLPGVTVHTWSGKKDPAVITPAPVPDELGRVLHVINYDILPARLEELKALTAQAVIFDESHHCRNGKAARTVAANELAKRKPVRLCLTGTPSENAPQELLPQLQMLGRLEDLGGFQKFVTRYLCAVRKNFGKGKVGWDFGGAAHLPELHEKLRATCFLRRTTADVQSELPEAVVTRVPIPMSLAGIAGYNAARKNVKAWITEKAAVNPAYERTIAHLPEDEREFHRAAKIAACVEKLDGMELLHQFGALRRAVLEAKLDSAREWLLHHCEGEKMVLFGHHRAGLRDFAPSLAALHPLIIDGDTPVTKRSHFVKAFTEDPRHRLMLANFAAAGTGLDGLQHAARHMAQLEWPWTPGTQKQIGARLRRTGQKHTVNQWHLICPGTIDDESLDLLGDKAETADLITDGKAASQNEAFTRARKQARGLFQ